MTDRTPRIVFMGTPEFAVASLDAIVQAGFDVAAVVTVPDKPSGRGQKLSMSPVKEYALAKKLPLLQPERLKDEAFTSSLKKLEADIFVVVAFRMLPEQVWSIPPFGTFNAHASLLPQYRGAAPINHAIINGETTSGVTTFMIDREIDTGKILLSREITIGPDDTAGELHDNLMLIASDLVVRTIEGLINNTITPVLQDNHGAHGTGLKTAPKIFPEGTLIRWDASATTVHNFIRGLSPYPGARAVISRDNERMTIKILGSRKSDATGLRAGEILVRQGLIVGCGDGAIEVTQLQAEGRKRMTAGDFLNGFDISAWHIVTEQ